MKSVSFSVYQYHICFVLQAFGFIGSIVILVDGVAHVIFDKYGFAMIPGEDEDE